MRRARPVFPPPAAPEMPEWFRLARARCRALPLSPWFAVALAAAPALGQSAGAASRPAVVAPSPGGVDRVHLKSGGVVEGRIVGDTEESVSVEIGNSARIEIDRRDVASVVRAVHAPESLAASRPASQLPEGKTWWGLVRDAEGSLLGTRQLTIGVDPADASGLRIEETYTLSDGAGSIRVTRIELADGEWRPKEAVYREVFDGAGTMVRAVVNGSRLSVESLDADGRQREELPFPADATFPLLFAESVRRRPPASGASVEATVFDPFVRSFALRTARNDGTRRLALDAGEPAKHQVVVLGARGIESATWLDPRGEPARVELNGADLVATRCTAEEAETARASADGLAVAHDLEGRVRLPAPSAEWRADPASAGAVRLARRDASASIVGCPLDVEPDATPEAAAHAVERRLRAGLGGYERVEPFRPAPVGALPSARFAFRHVGAGKAMEGLAVAVRGKRGAWAFVMTFPCGERASAERDLDRALARADLRID